MRAWSLPEDLTDLQRCVRFLQSDKALQQQLGVQMMPRVAAQAHSQVIPLAICKVQAMREDVDFLVMSGDAFKECVEECEQLLATPVAARCAICSRALIATPTIGCNILAVCGSSCGTSHASSPSTTPRR